MIGYVDGSCRLNTRKGGWAVVREDGNVHRGTVEDTTNNRMELLAAIHLINDHTIKKGFSDSLYVINGIRDRRYDWRLRGKKEIPNADLWDMLKIYSHRREKVTADVEWEWIPREQNKLADKEAKECSK